MHYLAVVLVFLLMVTLLVAAHEYGHYLFAKLCGMDVEEFSIGFGKNPICVWMRRGETKFTIRPLPFGGFVRIKGMIPEEDGSETQVPNGFYSKSPAKRLAVLFAGPLFSVLAGMLLMIIVLLGFGKQEPDNRPILHQIVKNSVAERAGLQAGDKVLAINGQPVRTWYEMTNIVRAHPAQPVQFTLQRGDKAINLNLIPEKSADEQPIRLDNEGNPLGPLAHIGRIGAGPGVITVPVGFREALAETALAPAKMVSGVVSIFVHPKNFSKDMGGPLSIAAATNEATNQGPFDVLGLAAGLSISLGILNLLPVPPLDGGQIVVAFAEMLRRGRRLSIQVQNLVNSVGLALVGMLIISVLWVDVKRFIFPDHSSDAPAASAPASR